MARLASKCDAYRDYTCLQGSAVLVTGADHGFGRAIASALHRLGATVYAGVLSDALQTPLPIDAVRATRYTLEAAEAGVASAMAAAAHAFEHGIGVAASATRAARWYRASVGARGQRHEEDDEQREGWGEEAEEEAMRLPGGDLSEHDVLSALARLYRAGGGDLPPDLRLSRQFDYLARSSLRRERASREVDDDSNDSSEGTVV